MMIADLCRREVVTCASDASIQQAAELMREHHVGDVIVAEDSGSGLRPVGIVTDRDLVVEVLAAQVDPDSISVGDLPTTELVTAREEDDVLPTIKLMCLHGIRRLPVVREDGTLAGIVTADDLTATLADALRDLGKLTVRERNREAELRSAS